MSARAEHARSAWLAMRTLVLDQYDRRPAVADALGMSYIRVKALRRVAAGPVTMRELAESIGSDPPYTSVLVQDLAARGLVERAERPDDRRVKVVSITQAGRETVRRADEIQNEPAAVLARLDPAELATLDRILQELLSR
ncbi:MAG TPA: MarR family transcriptional regulator [Jatrophihabitans sp.]|nr:MarR family transcriptional regulator [Jatrophihabitans sp.]